MFTANLNGSVLRNGIPFGKRAAHFEWRNDRETLATFRLLEGREKQHALFTDDEADSRYIGAGFTKSDGHCSFAPEQERMAADENVGSRLEKRLLLYDVRTKGQAVLAPSRCGRASSWAAACATT